MEWERQRKEQLMAEKTREYEQLTSLKAQSSNLKCELESLVRYILRFGFLFHFDILVVSSVHAQLILMNAFYPLQDDKILDWSKLKQTADHILKFI